jgi:hypothetical protein
MRKLLGTHALDFLFVDCEVLGNEGVRVRHAEFWYIWDGSDCLQG